MRSSQQFSQFFSRFHPAERFSGSIIKHMSNVIEMFLTVDREVGSFREVLAQQAVGVLIAASLPWAMGIAEIDLDPSIDG